MSILSSVTNQPMQTEKKLIGNLLQDNTSPIFDDGDRLEVLLTNADRLDLNKHRPPSAPPAFFERTWNCGSLQSTPMSSCKKSPSRRLV